jgi:hypothetical protein
MIASSMRQQESLERDSIRAIKSSTSKQPENRWQTGQSLPQFLNINTTMKKILEAIVTVVIAYTRWALRIL